MYNNNVQSKYLATFTYIGLKEPKSEHLNYFCLKKSELSLFEPTSSLEKLKLGFFEPTSGLFEPEVGFKKLNSKRPDLGYFEPKIGS
ncbi:35682_t:CDS:2 [Gigaspora margarita]|uniref:35682_t:CDS:1 n=1 Tax=Gigaspora margarita TaxID=4874 RepID=A0ABN7ULL4_GIGMA|nr:35682_t:CDS:2 [Gigaspora margarita]